MIMLKEKCLIDTQWIQYLKRIVVIIRFIVWYEERNKKKMKGIDEIFKVKNDFLGKYKNVSYVLFFHFFSFSFSFQEWYLHGIDYCTPILFNIMYNFYQIFFLFVRIEDDTKKFIIFIYHGESIELDLFVYFLTNIKEHVNIINI